MKTRVSPFFDESTNTVSYVVTDSDTHTCAIIDPVLDYDAAAGRTSTESADRLAAYVQSEGLGVEWILETHVHADHISAAPCLKQKLGGKIAIGRHVDAVQKAFKTVFNLGDGFKTDGSQFDYLIDDGEEFSIGSLEAKAIATPGHTPACMTYLIGDAAFVGDTLFMPDSGTARTDFPGGDAATLYQSIHRIFSLPDETRLFMCHDYKAPGREEYRWETTVAKEKEHNIHIHTGVDEEAFVAFRIQRDGTLRMPALILPSVQLNMRAGDFPPEEDNGSQYLKIPLNVL